MAYQEGEFCWVELSTADEEESLPFYKKLLGLNEETLESEDGSSYYMMKEKANYVFGLYENSGDKSSWTSYINVKSIEKIAEKVEKLGGYVDQAPMDVMDAGRLATFVDPTGASFSVWQAKHHKGAGAARNATGMFGWHELATSETDKAVEFYSELFGWKAKTKKGKNGNYTVMSMGDVKVCGINDLGEDLEDVPAHWLVFFNVKDCDKSADLVKEMGGEVYHKPLEQADVGRYTVVRDPAGAHLGILASKGGAKKKTAKKTTAKKTTKKAAKKTAAKKKV